MRARGQRRKASSLGEIFDLQKAEEALHQLKAMNQLQRIGLSRGADMYKIVAEVAYLPDRGFPPVHETIALSRMRYSFTHTEDSLLYEAFQ